MTHIAITTNKLPRFTNLQTIYSERRQHQDMALKTESNTVFLDTI